MQKLAYEQGGLNINLYPEELLSKIKEGIIYKYKIGQMEDDRFIVEMKGMLKTDISDDEIVYCWNKQCELESKDICFLREIAELQTANRFKIHIIGNTNRMNHNYIQKQFNEQGINLDVQYYLSFDYEKFDPKLENLQGENIIDLRDKENVLQEIKEYLSKKVTKPKLTI